MLVVVSICSRFGLSGIALSVDCISSMRVAASASATRIYDSNGGRAASPTTSNFSLVYAYSYWCRNRPTFCILCSYSLLNVKYWLAMVKKSLRNTFLTVVWWWLCHGSRFRFSLTRSELIGNKGELVSIFLGK